MSLSFEKLLQLFRERNLVSLIYYVDADYICRFIKFKYDYTEFMMYIPSKYTFTIDKSIGVVYVIKDQEDEQETIKTPDELRPQLDKIDLDDTEKMKLESIKLINYSIDKLSKYLAKLIVCVENIPYKLGILYKDTFLTITRGNEISTYIIKDLPDKQIKKVKEMFILTDLEVMIERSGMMSEIREVKNSLMGIFHKNYQQHILSINTLISNKTINFISIITKIKKYDQQLARLEKLYTDVNIKKNIAIKQLQLYTKNNNSSLDTINTKKKLEEEINKLHQLTENTYFHINIITSVKDDLLINMNRLFFENETMLIQLNNNYDKLAKYI